MAFDYEISTLISMKMEGIAEISTSTLGNAKINAGKIYTQGNLVMKQPNAMKQLPYGKVRNVYDDDFFNTLESTSIDQFLYKYSSDRNETLKYDYRDSVEYTTSDQTYVDLDLHFIVPVQEVLYIPRFWQVIKFAWVKYFAQFIIYYFFLYKFFLNYLITGGVFDIV